MADLLSKEAYRDLAGKLEFRNQALSTANFAMLNRVKRSPRPIQPQVMC